MPSPRNEDIEMTDSPSNGNGSQSSTRRRSTFSQLNSPSRSNLPSITAAEARMANRDFLRKSIVVLFLVCCWYLFSISITVYNKWMFKDREGEKVFPFPLFTTCIHMLVQFSLAALVLFLVPSLRPTHSSVNPHAPPILAEEQEPVDLSKPLLTKKFYLTKIGPTGFFTGLDIGLGNSSLKVISLTFYTMCKSSVLGFVLLFAFMFGLEKPSWKLGGIIAVMSLGVFLMVKGETEFHLGGFLLVMTAAASSGLRWSLTQILLVRHPVTSNPFSTIFFLAPIMFVTLFFLALPVEGVGDMYVAYLKLSREHGYVLAPLILLFPGCLAFAMTASEFALLQRTSVVTLSICGIIKEALTITTATIVFGDALTPTNAIGLLITILTISAYNYIKIKKAREDAVMEAHDAFEHNASYSHVSTEDPDLEDGHLRPPRTNGMLRNSLSISVSGASNGAPENNKSPVKRPEDLE